ncbi:MAG: hypothetical protein GY851_22215 [bacterium]|nr:hypothetical protein [bacterium]
MPPKRTTLRAGMTGAVMDMDGTTTTTEPLCLHSLDTMVRRITGHAADPAWRGLDRERDYPHIIGNSTTKHVEYLVRTYDAAVSADAVRLFYLNAAAWTLGRGRTRGGSMTLRPTWPPWGSGTSSTTPDSPDWCGPRLRMARNLPKPLSPGRRCAVWRTNLPRAWT